MNFPRLIKIYVSPQAFSSCFIIILTLASSAYGQTYLTFRTELERIYEQARWRLGPFLIYPTLELDMGYDSNVYGVREDRDPVSDYVVSIAVPLNAYLIYSDRLILSFLYIPQYVYFFEVESERSFNNSFSSGLRYLFLNKFVLTGAYQYSQKKYRALTEIDTRITETIHGGRGGFYYETARSTSIGISGSYFYRSYEDAYYPEVVVPLSRTLNRNELGVRGEFNYRIFTESFFFMNLGFADYKFEYPESSFKNSYSFDFYSGIRFPLLGRIRGILSLGYKWFIPYQGWLNSFSGFVGNTSLDFRLARFGWRLSYLRDVPFSVSSTNIFYVLNSIGAGISFYPFQIVRLDYDFTYSESNYQEPTVIENPEGSFQELTRMDDYKIHSVAIVFRIVRNTGIGLRANYEERISNYYGDRYKLLIGAFITYDF